MQRDTNVPIAAAKRGRPTAPEVRSQVERFKHFRAGRDSFFVPDATVKDLEYLRRPVQRAGMGIAMRQVEDDAIYGGPGVRVWRLAGSYDEI